MYGEMCSIIAHNIKFYEIVIMIIADPPSMFQLLFVFIPNLHYPLYDAVCVYECLIIHLLFF